MTIGEILKRINYSKKTNMVRILKDEVIASVLLAASRLAQVPAWPGAEIREGLRWLRRSIFEQM